MRQEDKEAIAQAQSHIPAIKEAIRDMAMVVVIDHPEIPQRASRALDQGASFLSDLIDLATPRKRF